MVYSYKHSFSGFSAKLNATQAMALSKMVEVISVFESKTLQLHTTRSWDFLHLPLPMPYAVGVGVGGHNIVIGVFDSGVWPESESFQEPQAFDIGPIPCTWKGQCVKAHNFDPASACNRKLIGARYYLKGFQAQFGPLNYPEFPSPRDFLGHGTHTASTAVGSIVNNVSFKGLLGQGIARGGAPMARLAVYKVCWGQEFQGKCTEADIMAAFDDALRDGVHVISASFGTRPPLPPFFASSSAIGSFHAMQEGVTVVFSAGNDGPEPSLVQNVSPWSICVAASSIDRTFPTQIVVDDRIFITGESLITMKLTKAKLADAINYFMDGICKQKNRIAGRKSAAGKVVLCFSTIGAVSIGDAQDAVKMINASALIFAAPITMQLPDVDTIPTVRIGITQATKIKNFLAELPRLPAVQIGVSKTVIGKLPAPTVAYFSSRGPSSILPDILKPDISAPGVNILAAWPPETPPTVMSTEVEPHSESEYVKWNFQSGTSMSCPHISGVVALIKSAHPTWSPAAIRSALITTATKRDSSLDSILAAGGSNKASDPFDIGAGQVNPLKAMHPGLVYDIKTQDYIIFLCNIGFTEEQIRMVVNYPNSPRTQLHCPSPSTSFLVRTNIANLNYPSITLANVQSTITIKRTVHNVADNKNSIYFVTVIHPKGVKILVWPRILIFSCYRHEISYYITTIPLKKSRGRYHFGEIVWSDGFHRVTSPLVVSVGEHYKINHASI